MKKLLALAAATALATGSAHAAPLISYTTQPDGSFSAFFGDSPKTASFSDLFLSFTVTNPLGGLLTGTLSTSGIAPQNDLDFGVAEILGPGGLSIPFNIVKSALTGKVGNKIVTNPDGLELGDISGVQLAPGTYTVHVTGSTFGPTGNGSYAGTLDFVASSAPEPAAWALMILGFGAIGFAMRRQRTGQRLTVAYA